MFYKFLKISIGAAVRIFFRKIVVVGAENIPSGKPVILVSNHPSAFMDPLVLGIFVPRELYFFARADIFTSKFVNWITEKAHMSPIYRIVDGADSLEKNEAVFAHGYNLLFENKVLLLFGEGVTDEEFVRRVKTMKKGSMRIALGAESKFDFKLGVNIICAGINYSDPRKFRSDLLISFSKPIEVRDYKNLFLEHNNKGMLELNKEIYSRLKEQIIHIENPENTELLEQLLIVTRKGINNEYYDENIPLEKRWGFSKILSEKINSLSQEKIYNLKEKTNEYFNKIKNLKVQKNKDWKFSSLLFLLFTFPVFIFGTLNNYLPIKLATFFSRKISKRPVFWSGTDMAFSIITVPVYYFIAITIFQSAGNFSSVQIQLFAALIYLISMPLSGIFAFNYVKVFSNFSEKIKSQKILKEKKKEAEKLSELRNSILEDVKNLF